MLGAAHKSTWGARVVVHVHHVPESEDFEEGYGAITMKGVPYGVIITGSVPDAPQAALAQLISSLMAFGFAGRVAVEDATYIDGMQRYEIDLSG